MESIPNAHPKRAGEEDTVVVRRVRMTVDSGRIERGGRIGGDEADEGEGEGLKGEGGSG